jgi:ABC-type transporter Mla subunit MlaD
MTRRLATALLIVAVAVALAAATSDETDGGSRFTVELDNAFGMVVGGDVRVAGTNAGTVESIELDERTKKALVEVKITEDGYGSFRSDAFCETRPQSPLGEFFLDCRPGTKGRVLEDGARIRVERTASTIPPDLVVNVMRRPFRERFRLILAELGAGLAGRPDDLNAAIRRGVPALRQSSRLLSILADHNREIRDLVTNADRVIGRLADNKEDVGRFVEEARDTAEASAERSTDIARNFNRLPVFLRELTPTMAALERTSREQRPVLVDLRASAGELRRFFDLSAQFSDASRPALRALGDAAPIGRDALRAAEPRIRELRAYAKPAPDLASNLAITLEDFDDPDRAVEKNPLAPGGRGFSGTEAILQYVLIQTIQSNAYDELGHMARVSLVQSPCAAYQNAQSYNANRDRLKDCRAWLGPNQPGVNRPDPTRPASAPDYHDPTGPDASSGAASAGAAGASSGGGASGGGSGARSGQPEIDPRVAAELDRALGQILAQPQGGGGQGVDPTQLLDFLLAP